jgi:hypothetical protein
MSHSNIKRVVAQKMVTHQNKNGRVRSMVDLVTSTQKNNNRQIIRHLRENNKRSTILIKSKGKKYNVIEKIGDNEPVKQQGKTKTQVKKILKEQRSKLHKNNSQANENQVAKAKKRTKRKLSVKGKINSEILNRNSQERKKQKKSGKKSSKPKSPKKPKRPKSPKKPKRPKSPKKSSKK